MEQLPKIVLQRLRATAKPEVHPDPDLLAAFAEKCISDRERVPVLEHLAHCADCREIVSLAQPQFELERVAAAAAVAPPVRSSWLRGPILRWAALAACVVVVAGGAFMLRRQSLAGKQRLAVSEVAETMAYDEKVQTIERENQLATKPELSPQPSPKSEAIAASAGKARALGSLPRKQKKTAEGAGQATLGMAMPDKSMAAGGATAASAGIFAKAAKPAGATSSQEQALKAERDRISSAMEAVAVEPASPPIPSERAEVKGDEIKAKDGATATAQQPVVASGKLPPAQRSAGGLVAGRNETLYRATAGFIAPRWTLSSDGTLLLRSLDAGKTWQAVPVGSKVVLRAVAALGSEIWVGGSGGALYHSSDIGKDWKKVEPTVDGKVLEADIVAIEFIDVQHGKLTTASREIWTTSDGGQSWQKK